MSSQLKEEIVENVEEKSFYKDLRPKAKNATRVNLNDLLSKVNKEKKAEKKSNIIFSAAAISAAAVLGVILTL